LRSTLRAQANLSLESRQSAETLRRDETPSAGQPAVGRAHLTLALALRLKGYHEEALRECRAALDAGEDPAAALEAIGSLHLMMGQPHQALDAYDRCLAVNDDNQRAWNQRGIALYLMGRQNDAEESFRRCLSGKDGSPAAWNNLGTILWDAGEVREATNAFRRASRGNRALLTARLNLALALFRQGHFQLSLDAYRSVARDEPRNAIAWNGIARALLEFGQFAEARDACVKAIEIEPDFAWAHRNLSAAFSALGDSESAAECDAHADRIDPRMVPQTMLLEMDASEASSGLPDGTFAAAAVPDYTLATDYLSKGLYDRALGEIRRAMARGADEKEGMVLLGKCFAARGDYEVAEKEFVAVLGAVPADDTAALELASVYRAMGRPADALRRVVGLLRQNVYHFAALVVLGESLLDLKRTRDAARAFARVLKFDPNHRVARKYSSLAAGESR
jgi:tetratricopeptide (TPR) repeat protein